MPLPGHRVLALLVATTALAGILSGCGGGSSKSASHTATSKSSTTAPPGSIGVKANIGSKVPAYAGLPSATKRPNGERVLAAIHASRPVGVTVVPSIAGFDQSSVTGFIHQVDGDVGAFWQAQLNHAGYQYTPANETIITQPGPVQLACSSQPWTVDTRNAAYCSADNTFYLPLNFLTAIDQQVGDAALAAVIAHENGHHVQELLGILTRYQQGAYKTIQIELQADCLAGIWMASVYQRRRIQPGDIDHATTLLNDVADPSGVLPTDPRAHGGPRQRNAAFLQGYNSGNGASCEIPALPTSES